MIRATTSLLVTLAAFVAFALPADARAATNHATSSNWAGYAASGSGVRFRSVAAGWVQPAATCTAGERRYSAYWIGLGGMHSTSTALEQIGTQVDCSSTGHPVYSAWYELVPAGPVSVHLAVNPGDKLSAKVTVSRGRVKLHLANRTRGTAFTTTRRLPAKRLDVSSAEWIVEAPSACDASGCHTLPLANFGSASFTGARATNVAGRTGPIAHPAWSATAIDLSPGGGDGSLPTGLAVDSSVAGATPSGLSAGGDAFTVTYNGAPAPTTAPAPAPEPVPPAPEPTPVPASPAPSTPAPASPAPAPIPLPTLPLPLPVAPPSPPAGSPGA